MGGKQSLVGATSFEHEEDYGELTFCRIHLDPDMYSFSAEFPDEFTGKLSVQRFHQLVHDLNDELAAFVLLHPSVDALACKTCLATAFMCCGGLCYLQAVHRGVLSAQDNHREKMQSIINKVNAELENMNAVMQLALVYQKRYLGPAAEATNDASPDYIESVYLDATYRPEFAHMREEEERERSVSRLAARRNSLRAFRLLAGTASRAGDGEDEDSSSSGGSSSSSDSEGEGRSTLSHPPPPATLAAPTLSTPPTLPPPTSIPKVPAALAPPSLAGATGSGDGSAPKTLSSTTTTTTTGSAPLTLPSLPLPAPVPKAPASPLPPLASPAVSMSAPGSLPILPSLDALLPPKSL